MSILRLKIGVSLVVLVLAVPLSMSPFSWLKITFTDWSNGYTKDTIIYRLETDLHIPTHFSKALRKLLTIVPKLLMKRGWMHHLVSTQVRCKFSNDRYSFHKQLWDLDNFRNLSEIRTPNSGWSSLFFGACNFFKNGTKT